MQKYRSYIEKVFFFLAEYVFQCEILYLYGVMLLILDIYIDGIIRERLLVSHYRYCAQRYSGTTTVDDVCKLVRSTGFEDGKRQPKYPVDYFKLEILLIYYHSYICS